jgi:hypothetical protein
MELENVFFFAVLGLELRAYTLSHSTSPFLVVVFSRQGLANYLLGWLRNTILVISASCVSRIIGVSYQHPTRTSS